MSKGAVSDKQANSLMALGLGTPKQALEVIDASDLVIAVGYDIAELDPVKWNKRNKPVIHIDFTPTEVYEFYQPEVEVVADISNTLWNLNQQISKKYTFPEAAEYRQSLEEKMRFSSKDFPIHPRHALLQLRKALSEDAIVVSDVGVHKMWVCSSFPTYSRGGVIVSNGFASMGIALPGAIGAKLAVPEAQVVSINGDGGFLMNVHELETAVRLGLDFTAIIFSDSTYSLIESKFIADAGSSFATDFTNPDFRLLAQSFGCNYFGVEKPSDLPAVYEQALDSRGVSIVEVPVDKSKNAELFQ